MVALLGCVPSWGAECSNHNNLVTFVVGEEATRANEEEKEQKPSQMGRLGRSGLQVKQVEMRAGGGESWLAVRTLGLAPFFVFMGQ